MAGEIQSVQPTGLVHYAVILRGSDGLAYNGSTFEAPLAADWGSYAIALAEQSTTGIYEASMPGVTAGTYGVLVYRRAGGSPATTDAVVAAGPIAWTGAAVEPPQTGDAFARLGATPPTTSQIAAALFVSGGTYKLNVDGSGWVAANNLPADYQQRGVAATLPSIPTDWISAAGVSAGAVTKLQSGLATAAQIPAEFTSSTFASAGVFAVAALANAPAGGGGGTADWTTTERSQIRYRLSLDGSSTAPAAAALPAVDVRKIMGGDPTPIPTPFDASLVATGMDRVNPAPEPGVPTTFRGKLLWGVMREWEASKTPTQIVVRDGAGHQLTQQAITDDGAGNESISPPS